MPANMRWAIQTMLIEGSLAMAATQAAPSEKAMGTPAAKHSSRQM